ncbi:MAG TPA: TIGR03089 family protein [Marmoricola sp.]
MTTFPELLGPRLAADPGGPLLTFYDDASGERTELSTKTFANWVSKTANLYAEELMLDPGDTIRIALPPHWLGPVFLGAAWCVGLDVVDTGPADAVVVGPSGLDRARGTTLACSLTPFATPFPEPLPAGVLDHGVLWAGQSDVYPALDATDLDVPAADDRRVLTDLDPVSPDGRRLLLGLLAGTGSLVLVANPDESGWPARSQSERATASVRTGQPSS